MTRNTRVNLPKQEMFYYNQEQGAYIPIVQNGTIPVRVVNEDVFNNQSQFLVGEGSPIETLGNDEDNYLDTVNGNVFRKENGSWVNKGNLTGPEGPQGSQGDPGPRGEAGEKGEDGTGNIDSVNGKTGEVTLNKEDIGLGDVLNVEQASKDDLEGHTENDDIHTTFNEKQEWNNKASTEYVDQSVENAINNIDLPDVDYPVTSVNEKKGNVTINKSDIGLANVSNIKQASKIEFDQHVESRSNPHGITSEQINNNYDFSSNELDSISPAEVPMGVNIYHHSNFVIFTYKTSSNQSQTRYRVILFSYDRTSLTSTGSYYKTSSYNSGNEQNATWERTVSLTPSAASYSQIDNNIGEDTIRGWSFERLRYFLNSKLPDIDSIKELFEHTEDADNPHGITSKQLSEIPPVNADVDGSSFDDGLTYFRVYAGEVTGYPLEYGFVVNYKYDNTRIIQYLYPLVLSNGTFNGLLYYRGFYSGRGWSNWRSIATTDYVDNAIDNIDIPNFEAPVESVNGKTGEVEIDVEDINGFNSDALALGDNTQAFINSLALGSNANAKKANSIALGHSADSDGEFSTAIGSNSSATGLFSTALGYNAVVLNTSEGKLGNESTTWTIPGYLFINGTKNFEMPHPHPDKQHTHRLRHAAVESPTAGDNLYRFEIEATEALQEVEVELPDYFQYLNKNVDVWVNGVDHFGRAYGKVEGNILKVTCEYAGLYKALVIGTRNDDHQSVKDWDIKGVEREIGESWIGETYAFEVDEIIEVEEIKEETI